ncbi:hypothetical protein CAter282_0919 [Collimonas arenae]|uniref:Uncharacterized protein n=1 Tax=Collimonas arenae TaxID=279058 RepID=A0A127PM06_9BURK|nr:hypothetical protein [Collimonas arenae]AMO98822.1 hypothetical protein CAter10_0994 [Collimonas arenae]AMP08719.1 hypothetical protein CAter282_0919 [Collimonas arenae]
MIHKPPLPALYDGPPAGGLFVNYPRAENPFIGKEDDPNSEVYKVRAELERLYQNVPIQKIGHERDGGYRIRSTEEDSFALEKIVEHYWYGRDSGIPAPTACTNAYSQQVIRAKK